MSKRHVVLLATLSIIAAIELAAVRVVLPVLQRRVGSFPGIDLIEGIETGLTAILMLGSASVALWFLLRFSERKNNPATHIITCLLLLLMAVAESVRLASGEPGWMDSLRHGLALVTIIFVAVDALVYGTTIARASVGIGSIALFASTLHRVVILYYPASSTARWLATTAETMSVLMPWVLAVVVTRRYMEDIVALLGAAVAVVLSTAAVVTAAPAVHLIMAQAIGFRFAMHPYVHVLTTGASFYFVIRSFRSDELPRQVPWAYIWLAVCGIQMAQPHVQMGALTALAVLAWTPPLTLPCRTRRWRFDETEPAFRCKKHASDTPPSEEGQTGE